MVTKNTKINGVRYKPGQLIALNTHYPMVKKFYKELLDAVRDSQGSELNSAVFCMGK